MTREERCYEKCKGLGLFYSRGRVCEGSTCIYKGTIMDCLKFAEIFTITKRVLEARG